MDKKLIEQLDREAYIIVRNDGLIVRNIWALIAIFQTNTTEAQERVVELNAYYLKNKLNHTFEAVLVADYKKANPTFTFD